MNKIKIYIRTRSFYNGTNKKIQLYVYPTDSISTINHYSKIKSRSGSVVAILFDSKKFQIPVDKEFELCGIKDGDTLDTTPFPLEVVFLNYILNENQKNIKLSLKIKQLLNKLFITNEEYISKLTSLDDFSRLLTLFNDIIPYETSKILYSDYIKYDRIKSNPVDHFIARKIRKNLNNSSFISSYNSLNNNNSNNSNNCNNNNNNNNSDSDSDSDTDVEEENKINKNEELLEEIFFPKRDEENDKLLGAGDDIILAEEDEEFDCIDNDNKEDQLTQSYEENEVYNSKNDNDKGSAQEDFPLTQPTSEEFDESINNDISIALSNHSGVNDEEKKCDVIFDLTFDDGSILRSYDYELYKNLIFIEEENKKLLRLFEDNSRISLLPTMIVHRPSSSLLSISNPSTPTKSIVSTGSTNDIFQILTNQSPIQKRTTPNQSPAFQNVLSSPHSLKESQNSQTTSSHLLTTNTFTQLSKTSLISSPSKFNNNNNKSITLLETSLITPNITSIKNPTPITINSSKSGSSSLKRNIPSSNNNKNYQTIDSDTDEEDEYNKSSNNLESKFKENMTSNEYVISDDDLSAISNKRLKSEKNTQSTQSQTQTTQNQTQSTQSQKSQQSSIQNNNNIRTPNKSLSYNNTPHSSPSFSGSKSLELISNEDEEDENNSSITKSPYKKEYRATLSEQDKLNLKYNPFFQSGPSSFLIALYFLESSEDNQINIEKLKVVAQKFTTQIDVVDSVKAKSPKFTKAQYTLFSPLVDKDYVAFTTRGYYIKESGKLMASYLQDHYIDYREFTRLNNTSFNLKQNQVSIICNTNQFFKYQNQHNFQDFGVNYLEYSLPVGDFIYLKNMNQEKPTIENFSDHYMYPFLVEKIKMLDFSGGEKDKRRARNLMMSKKFAGKIKMLFFIYEGDDVGYGFKNYKPEEIKKQLERDSAVLNYTLIESPSSFITSRILSIIALLFANDPEISKPENLIKYSEFKAVYNDEIINYINSGSNDNYSSLSLELIESPSSSTSLTTISLPRPEKLGDEDIHNIFIAKALSSNVWVELSNDQLKEYYLNANYRKQVYNQLKEYINVKKYIVVLDYDSTRKDLKKNSNSLQRKYLDAKINNLSTNTLGYRTPNLILSNYLDLDLINYQLIHLLSTLNFHFLTTYNEDIKFYAQKKSHLIPILEQAFQLPQKPLSKYLVATPVPNNFQQDDSIFYKEIVESLDELEFDEIDEINYNDDSIDSSSGNNNHNSNNNNNNNNNQNPKRKLFNPQPREYDKILDYCTLKAFGGYLCEYNGCNKNINGNKGALISHAKSHLFHEQKQNQK